MHGLRHRSLLQLQSRLIENRPRSECPKTQVVNSTSARPEVQELAEIEEDLARSSTAQEAQADWTFSFDVGSYVPPGALQAAFLANLGTIARRGVVLRWRTFADATARGKLH